MSNAIKNLIFRIADDAFILGHRNSEWTGIGPLIEEDLAFSSMAQDKIGHAQMLYQILHEKFGEADPDTLAFSRATKDFICCQFVELPIGEYDFSLVRHFLFDHAESLRYENLCNSSFQALADLAAKAKGELKYHTMHADTLLKQLGNGSEEANARLQKSLNGAWHYALAMFELSEFEDELINENTFIGEKALKEAWLNRVTPVIEAANLKVPVTDESKVVYGGRKGFHSEYLQPLLDEMRELITSDPEAEW